MLQHSFIHIPGIGAATERLLWESGIRHWDDVAAPLPAAVPAAKARLLLRHVGERRRLFAEAPVEFARQVPVAERWRLFPAFRPKAAYLDVETTGHFGPQAMVTAIALYDGEKVHSYVQGENLDCFVEEIAGYELLVTYNGRAFDVPVLERAFGIRLRHLHLDLRHILHRLGVKGGLKGCERRFGLTRGDLDGLDGYAAVLLWQEYRRTGDRRVLETLLAYNIEDTVNLETLMVHAYNCNLAATPFADSHRLPLPAAAPRPYQPDAEVVRRLRDRLALISAPRRNGRNR
ncbi:MAG: ribonuclease H-like domain-containing protein [Thermodesulfobacteriota bacterium]